MNKVYRYRIELGEVFDPTSNPAPAVYIDGTQTIWNSAQLTNVNSGDTVSLLSFNLTVPQDASKFLKYASTDKEMGLFLTSDNQTVNNAFGYLVGPDSNYIDIMLSASDLCQTQPIVS